MSFDNEAIFTKENLDGYLKELAKAFRKRNGTSMPAEIILVGGAAILVNYGFQGHDHGHRRDHPCGKFHEGRHQRSRQSARPARWLAQYGVYADRFLFTEAG